MIKCEVEVCAKITRAATVKESRDGNPFLSFSVQLPISGRDGSTINQDISVSVDGDKKSQGIYVSGRKVIIHGNLSIRKKSENTYFNLRADSVDLCKSNESSRIEGTLHFLGKIGKKGIEEHQDKKGNSFKSFSAFSSDKDGDDVNFTWVRFLYFSPKEDEEFLTANSFVAITGDLQIGVFHDSVSIDCKVGSVSEWKKEQKNND